MKKKSFLEKVVGSEREKQERGDEEINKTRENNNYDTEVRDIMRDNVKYENSENEKFDGVPNIEKELEESGNGDNSQEWTEKESTEEGQLTVDVYKTDELIVIKSIIGGVRPEDLDISVTSDMVTIRGKRTKSDEVNEEDYYYQECFWGNFSRSIILPNDIRTDGVEAIIKNGILTLNLPKIEKNSLTKIKVREE